MFLNTGNIIFLSLPSSGGGSTSNPSAIRYFDVYYGDVSENGIDTSTPVSFYVENIGENDHDK